MASGGAGRFNPRMAATDIHPFRPEVSPAAVQDLHERLARTRWPDELPDAAPWSMGCDLATLQRLCAAWAAFDVAGFFARLATWPQFTATVDGATLHFVHRRSPRPDAQPLVVTHGWPGSVWEFHRVLDELAEPADPAQPAYHVVCPTIPGYGFSGPTRERGWDVARVARAIAELMRRLGYRRYAAQGGDWGAVVSAHLAAQDPAHCVALHLNMVVAAPPDPAQPLAGVAPEELADVQALGHFRDHGTGYQHIQKTKPQSLAYGLTDSPAGLAGWVLEKFHDWADLGPAGGDVLARFGTDTLCANLSIYWFTGTANASTRLYYESLGPGRQTRLPKVPVPTAGAVFPQDLYRPPRRWAQAQYPRLVRWTRFPQGGHFAALEEPAALLADIRAFLPPSRFAAPGPGALLADRLATAPEAPAFIDGERVLSVRAFDDLVARTTAWLAAQGVGEGDVVAVWLVNRIEWLALYFALARRGAALMTVNTRYRGAEVAYLLARSAPKLLVLQPRFRGIDFLALLAEVDGASAASLQAVVVVQDETGPGGALGAVGHAGVVAPATGRAAEGLPDPVPGRLLDRPVIGFQLGALPPAEAEVASDPGDRPEAPSIMFTTSGTTSGPKLVVHTQRTVALHVQRIADAMAMHAADTVLLAALPFAGTFGFVSMLACFGAGRPVVLQPTWDAAEAAAALRRHAVTHLFGSDEMFEGLLAQVPAEAPAPVFPTLTLCGFAAFRAGAVAVAEAASARGLPMAGLYGSSEVHALFAYQRLDRPLAERLEAGGTMVNPDAEVKVVDAETGATLPPGEVGLLAFRSPSNFIGYLRHDEATAKAIDADGFFHSGDIGYVRPDGSFVYLTRAGDAIRLGGYLVAPAEIEEVIKALPEVAAAQVVAVDLDGKTRAVAFVIRGGSAAPAEPVSEAAVVAHVAGQLAAYKVPARVWFVDAFPVVLSANGTKIQRHRLREMAVQRLGEESGR